MWKKLAIQAGFMALDYGLKKRKKSKKRKPTSKKKTTKRGK